MSIARYKSVVVTGPRSIIGLRLIPRLVAAGRAVSVVSRRSEQIAGVTWNVIGDLSKPYGWPKLNGLERPVALVHTAYLPLLGPHISAIAAAGITRIVAFSSTSRFVKQYSPISSERKVAHDLADAEENIALQCEAAGIALTIFRPTLIFLPGRDQNVSAIASFIKRFRFVILPGSGKGKRQPVAADDLADAVLRALDDSRSFGRQYNLSGGETVTYRQMVERIFEGLGRKPFILPVPVTFVAVAFSILASFSRYAHLTPTMASRTEEDLVFPHDDAVRDFGYAPASRFNYSEQLGSDAIMPEE